MTEKEKTILCLGDSNTYGYSPDGLLSARYPANVRWTGLLKKAGWRVENKGVNGALVPTEYQYESFIDAIKRCSPLDAVTVMYGTNDVTSGRSAEETGDRMESFIAAIRGETGGARLILIAPPPVTFGFWVPNRAMILGSEKLSACYKSAAGRQGVVFADAGCWGVSLTRDGVHFTSEGHEAFFKGLSEII